MEKSKRTGFGWAIHRRGYFWSDGYTFLTPRSPEYTRYEPLDEQTGMALNLAYSEPSPDGILAFANRHGLLGIVAKECQEHGRIGERREAWVEQILALRQVVRLADLAKANDRQTLSRHLKL